MSKLMYAGRVVTIFLMLIAENASAQLLKASSGSSNGRVWEIPFASRDNTISLSIQNNSNLEAKNVSVKFSDLPSWIEFKSDIALIGSIAANGSGDAGFTFSVDKKAPVGKDTTLTAVINTTDGQEWTKKIRVSVTAPGDHKLYNNFPNPFNPSTKVAFKLPKASHVRLIVYDIVGREVARIADGKYPAGYTELTWNGFNRNGEQVSSGVYFYRISTDRWNAVKKMVVMK